MISGYELKPLLPPEKAGRFQLGAALGAGFIVGAVFCYFRAAVPGR